MCLYQHNGSAKFYLEKSYLDRHIAKAQPFTEARPCLGREVELEALLTGMNEIF